MTKEEIKNLLLSSIEEGQKTLDETTSKEILKCFGIPAVEEREIKGEEDLKEVVKSLDYPVVLKGVGKNIAHKSELGLVKTNIYNFEALKKAYYDIISKRDLGVEKVVLQPQIQGMREFVAGIFRDPDFGPVVMFGLGGIFTEALRDYSLRICPVEKIDIMEAISEIRSSLLLKDFRGEREVNLNHIEQILTGLCEIACSYEQIREIDINPIVVRKDGSCICVDALIGIGKREEKRYPQRISPSTLREFFYPRSVVFIGASANMGKWGHLLPANVISGGYKGDIYLVNKKGGEAFGRKMYPSLEELPDNIDLAVITVPARFVLDLIPELAKKNIHHAVLITAGFKETGKKGEELEGKLVKIARENNVYIVGPNTMGLSNPHINFHCIGTLVQPKPGPTAMVSQSGNMGVQLLSFANEQGIGIRGFCGSGNEAMVCIEDYLEGFYEDELTSTVMLYVESVKNGKRFFELAKKVSRKKPIILLKGGETKAGIKAASTHTGAMATNSKVFNVMCKQAGILKVDGPAELLNLAAAFSSLPLPKGNKVVIITLGGGWGVITADLCAKYGLELPELPSELIELIDKRLPDFWSRANPIDLVGEWDIEIPKMIIDNVLKWDGCDAVINLGILGRKFFIKKYGEAIEKSDPSYSKEFLNQVKDMVIQYEEDFLKVCGRLMDIYEKPIVGVRLNTEPDDKTVYNIGDSKFKPVCYDSPEDAVRSCARMYEYFLWKSKGEK